jgi:hypothetical protein
MKTSELTGAALDWAVAKCEGATNLRHDTVATWWFTLNGEDRALSRGWSTKQNFAPSTDWAQGGPIIDREDIAISPAPDGLCSAYKSDGTTRWLTKGGPTPTSGVEVFNWTYKQQGYHPLIAAMRCYVASKLGDDVDVPEELT